MIMPIGLAAEVSYDDTTDTLRVVGPTDHKQVVDASNIIREEDVAYVEMWGPGGYMVPGLQLGNYLSTIDGLTVVIPKGKACISACAMAALGAGHIRVDGKLMLHRPYVGGVSSMDTLEDSMSHMGKGYLKAAYYLEDHGYPRKIMQQMMEYTNPCKFMLYEGIEVKTPEDLILWVMDDRCGFMWRIQR